MACYLSGTAPGPYWRCHYHPQVVLMRFALNLVFLKSRLFGKDLPLGSLFGKQSQRVILGGEIQKGTETS